MEEASSFGKRLKRLRRARGLTQQQLATATHCSVHHIRRIERGERRPSHTVAELMAHALSLPPDAQATFIRDARGEAPLAAGAAPTTLPAIAPVELNESRAVALEIPLSRLAASLQRSLQGQGQVVLISGETGRGKSTLVRAFVHEAQEIHPGLLVVAGYCSDLLAVGYSYLPLQDALTQLVTGRGVSPFDDRPRRIQQDRLRQAHTYVVETIIKTGPDLIDVLVPAADLQASPHWDAPTALAGQKRLQSLMAGQRHEYGGLTQPLLFQQFSNVLQHIARRHPILLIIEDLHWADRSSLSLLSYLTRRVAGSRLLIIGTYRAAEVAVTPHGDSHPLRKVFNEVARLFGEVTIDLDATPTDERRRFVDALIDREPNQLDRHFRDQLFTHTSGHPLFTTELLDAFKRRGNLWRNEAGVWEVGGRLDWHQLPARVEAIINERIRRLDSETKNVLSAAAVEGERFTAEVIAQVETLNLMVLLRTLSHTLAEQHQLIEEIGGLRTNGQALTQYRFLHALFRQHLYQSLSAGERRILHRAVASALESLYHTNPAPQAGALAHHFRLAGETTRAIAYLQLAGEHAVGRLAYHEAVANLTTALDLIGDSDPDARFGILLARAECFHVQGERRQQAADLEALQQLAATAEIKQQVQFGLARCRYLVATGHVEAAADFAERAIEASHSLDDSRTEAECRLLLGQVLFGRGRLAAAETEFQAATALAHRGAHADLEIEALRRLGRVATLAGHNQQADQYLEQALSLTRDVGARRQHAWILLARGRQAYWSGDIDQTQSALHDALQLFTDIGDRRGENGALQLQADVLWLLSDFPAADRDLKRCLAIAREIDDPLNSGAALYGLCRSARTQRQFVAAHAYLSELKAVATAFPAVQVSRAQVAILNSEGDLRQLVGDYTGAQRIFEEAIAVGEVAGLRRQVATARFTLGHIKTVQGNIQAGIKDLHACVALAREISHLRLEGNALTLLGPALAELGEFDAALATLSQGIDVWHTGSSPARLMEAYALQADVWLRAGDKARALQALHPVLEHLDSGHNLLGSICPTRVHHICHTVLQANEHPDAARVLTRGYALVTEIAARIADETDRRGYLSAVPWHRAMLEAYRGHPDNRS